MQHSNLGLWDRVFLFLLYAVAQFTQESGGQFLPEYSKIIKL